MCAKIYDIVFSFCSQYYIFLVLPIYNERSGASGFVGSTFGFVNRCPRGFTTYRSTVCSCARFCYGPPPPPPPTCVFIMFFFINIYICLLIEALQKSKGGGGKIFKKIDFRFCERNKVSIFITTARNNNRTMNADFLFV